MLAVFPAVRFVMWLIIVRHIVLTLTVLDPELKLSIMDADALAPFIARSSAAMLLTLKIGWSGSIWGSISITRIHAISKWLNDMKCKYVHLILQNGSVGKGLKIHGQYFAIVTCGSLDQNQCI